MACALTSLGCPTYEDEYSGHFREVLTADRAECFERRSCNAIAVDFFRFGEYTQAIVREYAWGVRNTSTQPFVDESRCVWTQADRFDQDSLKFNVPINERATEESVMRGILSDDGDTLDIEIVEPNAVLSLDSPESVLSLTLERIEADSPNPDCDTINSFLLNTKFEGDLPSDSKYTVENPVFALVWFGFERLDSQGGVIFIPTRSAPQPWLRLNGDVGDGFRPSAIQITPPDAKYLTRSGDTRYGLAHMIVVDDAEESARFTWDKDEEPMVATAFRDGVAAGWDGRTLDTPRSGRALFFVEGELDELDPALLEIFTNDLEAYPLKDSHYFVVDVVADGDEMVAMTLPETRTPEASKLRLTDEYVSERKFDLPRVFPVSSQ